MLLFSTLLFSLFTTMALIPILRRYADRIHCLDEPCERKVHCTPMPKVGGIAMAVGTLIPMLLLAFRDRMVASILTGCTLIVLFGFLDDVKNLGYRAKFAAQLSAALVVVLFGGLKISYLGSLLPEGWLLPEWLAVPLTVIAIVGVTNAINLSDGLDGLAGGTMLLCFICLGFLAYRAENLPIALLAVATGGAIFGFLRFNTYPATVFMGDAGSQLLGFLAITMALTLSQGSSPLSPFFPLLLLGLPILDTLMVMGERIASGRSPFTADKNHLHHKLLKLNFFHSEAVFIIYVLQAFLVTVAYLLRYDADWIVLLVYMVFACAVLAVFASARRSGWRFSRPGLIDRKIKEKLRIHVRDRFMLVKMSQTAIETGFTLLLIVTCLLPAELSRSMSFSGAGLIAVLGLVTIFRSSQMSNALRLVIYFFIPLVIYYSEIGSINGVQSNVLMAYNISFGVLVFLAIVTLKTTRRTKGFKSSPLDFILLFIAVVVPNLPDAAVSSYHLGFLAAKIIVLFFVFEVLMGELRGQLYRLNLSVVVALLVIFVKGFI